MAFTYVTITETYEVATDVPARGTVEFEPVDQMHNGITVVSATVSDDLDTAGTMSVRVAATTDPATRPVGVTYKVTEKIVGQATRIYYVSVPHNQGSTLQLSSLPASSTGGAVGFALRNASDYDDSVAPTDGQSMVWDGTASKFHPETITGGSGGVASVNGLTGAVTINNATLGAQPADSDLTAIASLAPSDGSLMERVAGAWAARTPTQVKGDLALDQVNNTSDLAKPLSTATTNALAAKAPLASPAFTGAPTAPRFIGAVVTVPYAASVTLDASLGSTFRCTATGDLTVSAITAGVQGQELTLQVLASGATRVVTFGSVTASVLAGERWSRRFVYDQVANVWVPDTDNNSGGGGAVSSVNGLTGAVTLTAATVGAQPADSDLTAIAALAPADGSLLERVAGAWSARTGAQAKADLGLDQVNNTSDAAKPLSTAATAALAGKAATASPAFTGTPTAPRFVGAVVTVAYAASVTLDASTASTFRCVASGDLALADITGGAAGQTVRFAVLASGATRTVTAAGSTTSVPAGQWWISTFTYDQVTDGWIQSPAGGGGGGGTGAVSSVNGQTGAVTLTASTVGAQPVNSDLTAISALTPTNGDLLERVGGAWVSRPAAQVKTDLALDQVNNTSDAAKPISTAAAAALAAKAPLASPTFTGTASAPRFVGAVVAVAYAASVTLDASLGTVFRCTAAGDLTVADITGGVNGQSVRFEVLASGATRTVTASGSATAVPAGQWWVGEFTYNASTTTWLQDPAGGSGGGGGTGAVSSVNGLTGAVTLTATSLSAQPIDSDLTAIAALAPADGSLLSRQAGVWTGRTTAQVKTDLGIATDISAAVAGVVNSAPAGLDTLGEIATALTADEATAAALATTVAGKAPLASPTFTGTVSGPRFVTPTSTLTAVSGTITPDAAVSSTFLHTATADVALADPTNGVAGQQIEILIYASGGDRTLTVAGSTTVIPASTYWWAHYVYDAGRTTWVLDDSGGRAAGLGLLNVKDFGVVGNGTVDDSAALKLAEGALTSGSALYFPPGCRVRFAQQNPAGSAALRLSGLSRVGVVMAPGAELIMDNLSSGSGTSHGIYVTGSCDDVRLEGCRVRWATAPSARSTGEAFRFLGYPSDSAPPGGWTTTTGPVSNVQLINCTGINAPQTGAIFMGCSDIRVVNFRVENTRADGLHFNACRRVNVNGYTAKWDSAIGDDGLAFVTYQHDTTIEQGANGPFNQPTLGAWSNTNSQASGVVVQGGLANGCRVSGSLDVTVTGLAVTGKNNSGLIIDSAVVGAGHSWAYHASRGVSVSNLTVQDCPIGIYIPAQLINSSSAPEFWTFDARITGATLRGATNYSVRVEGDGSSTGVVSGLHLANIRATAGTSSTGGKGGVSLSGLRDSRIDNITLINSNGAQLAIFGQETVLSGALSGLVRNNVSVGDVLNVGGKILFQDINGISVQQARSHSSPTDGVQFVRVVNADVGALATYLANRGNTGTVRGLHFQKVLHVAVARATIEHDSNTTTSWRSIEIGGGDATDAAANDLRLTRVSYTNSLNQTGSDINVQTGTGAPINYQYALAYYNGAEASPIWRTSFVDGPFAASSAGGMTPDIQSFTSSGTWTKPSGATIVTVALIGGGSGGGSGARRASGTATSGGAGGGGGGYTSTTLLASALGSTETVTVGTGGAGGAAVTANDTSGNAGSAGNASTFGSRKAIASGAGGGAGGTTGAASSGGGGSSAMVSGANGGAGASGAVGANGSTGAMGGAGGGAGGGISTTPAAFSGGTGGGAPQSNLNGGAGGAADTAGTAGSNGPTTLAISGSGGGGGGSSITGAGAAGANGGTYGAGGGGGGSALNGSNSGGGGTGAAGFVVVISQ